MKWQVFLFPWYTRIISNWILRDDTYSLLKDQDEKYLIRLCQWNDECILPEICCSFPILPLSSSVKYGYCCPPHKNQRLGYVYVE